MKGEGVLGSFTYRPGEEGKEEEKRNLRMGRALGGGDPVINKRRSNKD